MNFEALFILFFYFQMEDTLSTSLVDTHVNMGMAITAENLAEQYGISRAQCDEYALRSQTLWKKGMLTCVILPKLVA